MRASVTVDGRSLTVLKQVYPVTQKEKPSTHKAFMTKLKLLLPSSCKPIIVSNAGFRVPWFKLVESLGWDYVGRVRNATFCKNNTDEDWHAIKNLYRYASTTERSLGPYQMSRSTPFDCYMVVYKQKSKGRKKLTAT